MNSLCASSLKEQSSSLTIIRNELSLLGIDTSTPGLSGELRHAALMERLLSAESPLNEKRRQRRQHQREKCNSSSSEKEFHKTNDIFDPDPDASLSDLKNRLVGMGVETSTPGLKGRERKMILMERLSSALSVRKYDSDDEYFIINDDFLPSSSVTHYHPLKGVEISVGDRQRSSSAIPSPSANINHNNSSPLSKPISNTFLVESPTKNEKRCTILSKSSSMRETTKDDKNDIRFKEYRDRVLRRDKMRRMKKELQSDGVVDDGESEHDLLDSILNLFK